MTNNHKTGVKPKDALTTTERHLIDFTADCVENFKEETTQGKTHTKQI
ncbi:hypothetical protein ABIA69_004283 [Lysinibacillus parviboronicapiens]|uniref:Uncharacterized protein n=1 Tax=Lysinibacillus parviboronicapiens TaxID=436516 RepID=A0ABV2PQ48_9BACI